MMKLYEHQSNALKETADKTHVAYYHPPIKGYELYHDGFSDGVDKAIEIVKGGVVYEKL